MSKKCAKCEKTVYPIEELKCLDKIWHKMCFKCTECGMTLNMKNYKGYNKMPYCNAHYPTTQFTQVADTPENSRISKNTKMQSNLAYHSQFEKEKGKYIGTGVDLETSRLLENSRKQSGIKYHEDFEKMKGTKMTVADDPETLRAKRNMEIASEVEYKGIRGQNAAMEAKRGLIGEDQGQQFTETAPAPGGPGYQQPPPPQQHQPPPPQQQQFRQPDGPVNNGQVPLVPIGQPLNLMVHHPREQYNPPPEPVGNPPPPAGGMMGKPMFKAVYDYDAQDGDEVGFREGDYIIDPEPIDDGWMMGTVRSSGLRGMLPSNYVEAVN